MHRIVDSDESQISQQKSGENRGPIFHPRGGNQQKSNRECNERRTKAGPFRVRIVWMASLAKGFLFTASLNWNKRCPFKMRRCEVGSAKPLRIGRWKS